MNNLKVIEDYEDRRNETIKKEYEAISKALEALKTIIENNHAYLRYAQAKGWFELTPDEEKQRATHNALITIIGRSIDFDIGQARKLAFEILQEVNDHANAQRVAELLGLDLKPHEVE